MRVFNKKCQNKLIKILKQRKVCRHLSNAAYRGNEAANMIADIVIKVA